MGTAAKRSSNADYLPGDGYFFRSQQPLQVLLFLLPLLICYELGTLIYATDPETGMIVQSIRAHSLLRRMLDLFGASGYYLPGLMVVVVLLAWHIAQKDPWRVSWKLYPAMGVEAVVMAIPLLMFALVLVGKPSGGIDGGGSPWQMEMVASIGAGIYEELVFRLIAIALLHMLLVDLLALPSTVGAVGAVVLSAILFAAYHFSSNNPFVWSQFGFYFLAGVYFAGVYVLRGFGIVAGAHAAYDILIVSIAHGFVEIG